MVTISREREGVYKASCWQCGTENVIDLSHWGHIWLCSCGHPLAIGAIPLKKDVGVYNPEWAVMPQRLGRTNHPLDGHSFAGADISGEDLTRCMYVDPATKVPTPLTIVIQRSSNETLAIAFSQTVGVSSATLHPALDVNLRLQQKVLEAQALHGTLPKGGSVERIGYYDPLRNRQQSSESVYLITEVIASKQFSLVASVVELVNFENNIEYVAKFTVPQPEGCTDIGKLSVMKDEAWLAFLNSHKRNCTEYFGSDDLEFVPELVAVGTLTPEWSFFIMEKIDGLTLEQLINTKYPDGAPPQVALRFARALTLQLNFLHSLALIHGDINPRNVILCFSEEKRRAFVKLIDFSEVKPFRAINVERKLKNGVYSEAIGGSMWRWPYYGQGKRALAALDLYPLGVCIQVLLLGKKALECELIGTEIRALWEEYLGKNQAHSCLLALVGGLFAGVRLGKLFASAQSVLFQIDKAYKHYPDLKPMTNEEKLSLREGYGAKQIYKIHFDTKKGDLYLDMEAAGTVDLLKELKPWHLAHVSFHLADAKRKSKKL
jgi:serine/threonine protein kinase